MLGKGFDSLAGLPLCGISNLKQGTKLGIRSIMISAVVETIQHYVNQRTSSCELLRYLSNMICT